MSSRKPTQAERSAQRRRTFHTNRIATADTPTAAAHAACEWLVAEGRDHGAAHLAAITEAVTSLTQLTTEQIHEATKLIHHLRQEARP